MAIKALQAEAVQIPIKLEKRYPESKDEDITDVFMRGYLAGRSSAEAVQGWIPCSEKLPDDDLTVLVSGKWRTISGDLVCNVSMDWLTDDGSWNNYWNKPCYEVTAWMPLPTPYKGGDTDDV